MRKIRLFFISVLSVFTILVGCADQNNNNSNNASEIDNNDTNQEQNEAIIVVTLSKDDGDEVMSEEEVTINEGDILLDIMIEDFDAKHDNGFITSIDGIEADDPNEEGWLYYVNDEEAPVGAAEYELSADDKVRFDFQKWN